MPMDAMLVSAAVFLMFAVFACALVWADFQTRPVAQVAEAPRRKRRSF